ncbi:hypothetical protein C1H46_045637 [Malus baccata]|uniref:Uncharacterized protein n=1 Tax=Malus baccata TaxID=106549 RepID=A0A540K3Q3_MALBA|nr:hypothetical protein C1H46_045637 [Malus baccata]
MEQPEVGDSLVTFLDDPQPQPKESSVCIDFSNCSFRALIEDLPSAFEGSFYENIERFLDLCNEIHDGVSTCKLIHKNNLGVRRVPLYITTCTVLED